MKRILIGMLVQIASGVILDVTGMPSTMVGTISCSLLWIVCYHDATPNWNLWPKRRDK